MARGQISRGGCLFVCLFVVRSTEESAGPFHDGTEATSFPRQFLPARSIEIGVVTVSARSN